MRTDKKRNLLYIVFMLGMTSGLSLFLHSQAEAEPQFTRVEIDPLPFANLPSGKLYYNTWEHFGTKTDLGLAVSDDTIGTGATRKSDSKFQSFVFSGVNISEHDVVKSMKLEAEVTKVGTKSNTLNLMAITGTNNKNWDFGVDHLISSNPRQTVSTDVSKYLPYASNWIMNGKEIQFGLNQQTKQNSDKIDVHEFRLVLEVDDNTPPVITIAEPFIEVLSTGPLTEVDLGEVTAFDNLDGVLIPTTASSGEFPIGLNEVIWTVTDSGGNTTTKTQLVNVISIRFIQTVNNGEANLIIEDHMAPQDNDPEFVSATINSLLRLNNGILPLDINLIRDLAYVNQYRTNIQFNLDDGIEHPENCIVDEDGGLDSEGFPVEICAPSLYFLEIDKNNGDKLTVVYKGFTQTLITGDSGRFGGSPTNPTDPIRFTESDKYYIQSTVTVRILAPSGLGTIANVVQLDSNSDVGNVKTLNTMEVAPGVYQTSGITIVQTSDGSSNVIAAPIGSILTATRTDTGAFAQAQVISSPAVGHLFGADTTLVQTCLAGDPNTGADTDFDGICDLWEISSGPDAGLKIPTTTPGVYYKLPCIVGNTYTNDPTGATVCPTVGIPDLYVEFDYMYGHTPSPTAVGNVVKSFVGSTYKNPSTGSQIGVKAHIFVDNQIDHVDQLPFSANNPNVIDFIKLSQANFGSVAERTQCNINDTSCEQLINQKLTAKRQVFRYGINVHDLAAPFTGSSGYAEKPGNNFMVALGSFTAHQGSVGQQSGTLLHELGHTLDLAHGGTDDIQCKPNYPSVMNYLYQFNQTDGGLANRPLDFSPSAYSTIDENDLDDNTKVLGSVKRNIIIGGIKNDGTVQPTFGASAGTAGSARVPGTATVIDWDRNAATVTLNLSENIHYFQAIPECHETKKYGLDTTSGFTGLRSQDDWGKIVFNFRNTNGFANGAINILNEELIGANQNGHLDPQTPGIAVDAGEDVTVFENEIYSPIFFIGNNVHDDTLTMDIDYGDGTVVTVDPENFEPSQIDHIYANSGTFVVTVSLTVEYGDGTAITNTDTATVTVIPIYDEVIFSEPLSTNPYEIGRTIPVKFTVIENGESVTNLNPEIWVSYNGAVPNPKPATEKNSSNNIAVFQNNEYHYQMDSTGLPAGIPVSIIVILPDSDGLDEPHQTTILLKGS